MPQPRKFEVDDILVRPGTYFNPQTEVVVVVDDSPDLDTEVFNMEDFEGADWVLVSDETPVDENRRDELIEQFQVRYESRARKPITDDDGDPLEVDEEEELELE
jgi:hypothetical protein